MTSKPNKSFEDKEGKPNRTARAEASVVENFSSSNLNAIKTRALATIKEPFRSELTQAEVDEAAGTAARGCTDFDLAVVLKNPSRFCAKCGRCCRICTPIALTEEDVDRLSLVLGNRALHFIECTPKGWRIRKTRPCVFLEGNACRIYEYRPLVCRAYPLGSDGDNVTLRQYGHCKFVMNFVAFKTSALLANRLMDKYRPEVKAQLERLQPLYSGIGNLPTQLDRMKACFELLGGTLEQWTLNCRS